MTSLHLSSRPSLRKRNNESGAVRNHIFILGDLNGRRQSPERMTEPSFREDLNNFKMWASSGRSVFCLRT
jgi:hypothetical protein